MQLRQLVDLAYSHDMAWRDDQEPLTDRLLLPALPGILHALADLRQETDAWAGGRAENYPVGFCALIRDRVFAGLESDATVRSLTAAGLSLRKVFVILKDRYFQNAIQFGNLYIDVANDTVDPAKPWLEWMGVHEVPFENVGDLPTLIRVARTYHRCEVFPNLVFPLLAPVVPLLSIDEQGQLGLLHFQDGGFLKDLAEGFVHLRSWLEGAAHDLPPLPAPYTARLQAMCGANDMAVFPFEYRPCSFADVAAQAGDYAAAFRDPQQHDAILGVLRLVPEAVRRLREMDIRG